VRMLATRGGHRVVLVEPLPAMPATLSLVPVTYAPPRLLDGIKSLSYAANMLASRLAREQDGDEALLVTPHGRVLECPTSSFFLVRDGEVRTAPLADHVLDSITRRLVLAVAAVREEPVELAALDAAQEAFVASTPFEVTAVHRIGTHRFDAPGPRTREIALLVRERIVSELR
jgi:branched-chain amino acid aminotransferase